MRFIRCINVCYLFPDVQQLLVVKEEVLSEQQVWISSLDQLKRKLSPLSFIKDKLMEMIVEDQNQPGTQIQIDFQILMRLESLQNQILMTPLIGRRPENLNQV
ncbi:hypothetical protein EYF80_062692 [Liparis tanakae]|uniref:Uncharacterized protein n=1 Tax=Liparis tanakae TaxID=230148 RepID=A0A4Z2EEI3_9TELE|nr:hypothetical protein EYF80_062692 [Liparis tanakae]